MTIWIEWPVPPISGTSTPFSSGWLRIAIGRLADRQVPELVAGVHVVRRKRLIQRLVDRQAIDQRQERRFADRPVLGGDRRAGRRRVRAHGRATPRRSCRPAPAPRPRRSVGTRYDGALQLRVWDAYMMPVVGSATGGW